MIPATLRMLAGVALAYGVALVLYWPVRRRGGWAWAALACGLAAILACPLFVPTEHVPLRAVAVFVSVDLFFRLVDFTRQVQSGRRTSVNWPTYARFLIPWPVLLIVFNQRSRQLPPDAPRAPELLRAAVAGGVFAVALSLTLAAQYSPRLRESFLLDHAAKVLLFLVGIEALAQLLLGLERLGGFDSLPFIDRAYQSRTPAEFWFRYNQRVRLWLTLNVFLPAGGRRAPLRAIFAAFLVSALLHELAFGIATSRFDGYQALFFLLQAPAVMLSPALERFASRGPLQSALARGATIAWFSLTSILFFTSADRVLPFFYVGRPWLP